MNGHQKTLVAELLSKMCSVAEEEGYCCGVICDSCPLHEDNTNVVIKASFENWEL